MEVWGFNGVLRLKEDGGRLENWIGVEIWVRDWWLERLEILYGVGGLKEIVVGRWVILVEFGMEFSFLSVEIQIVNKMSGYRKNKDNWKIEF